MVYIIKVSDIESALSELSTLSHNNKRAKIMAGATDIFLLIKNKIIDADVLVDISDITELKSIKIENDMIKLGSLVTFSEILESDIIKKYAPALYKAAENMGSPQIRNRATIGGNVCHGSPSADGAIALIALEAKAIIKSPKSQKTIDINDIFLYSKQNRLKHDEILTEFIFPACYTNTYTEFKKIGKRNALSIAVVSAAVKVGVENGIIKKIVIAVGAVAPQPLRLKDLEIGIIGKKLTDDVINKISLRAKYFISPITDIRASADYRREITGIILKDCLNSIKKNYSWSFRDKNGNGEYNTQNQ